MSEQRYGPHVVDADSLDAEEMDEVRAHLGPRPTDPVALRLYMIELAKLKKVTYEWSGPRAAYIEGMPGDSPDGRYWPTLTEIAERFGISIDAVRKRSSREGWSGQRQQWQAQLETERRRLKLSKQARESDALDDRALDAAKMGMTLVATRMQEVGMRAQAAREENTSTRIDSRELDALAKALDTFHRIGLRAVGDVETARLEITGANGQPLHITDALRVDDPQRLAAVIELLGELGLENVVPTGDPGPSEEDGARWALPVGD